VAASILTAAYHIQKDDGVVYLDLGGDYFDRRDKKRAAQRLVRRLHDLGYAVTLQEAPDQRGRRGEARVYSDSKRVGGSWAVDRI
jgi:hypothetical protein